MYISISYYAYETSKKHHQKTNITWENYLFGVRSFVQKALPSDGPPGLEVRARFSVPHITFPLLLVKYIFFGGKILIASPQVTPVSQNEWISHRVWYFVKRTLHPFLHKL